ncbi:hypothetical protein ABPG75_000518 [Micractinium tetrahymenae]
MTFWIAPSLALLAALGHSAPCWAADTPLQPSATYQAAEPGAGDVAVLIPQAALSGEPLPGGGGGVAAGRYQECRLLAPPRDRPCALLPPVAAQGAPAATATSGFPAPGLPLTLEGFDEMAAVGIMGADLTGCPSSDLPGKCGFASTVNAAALCVTRPDCRTLVVYLNGTDDCGSSSVAVLKGAGLSPDNSFVAPSVVTLQQSESHPVIFSRLYESAAVVVGLPQGPPAGGASASASLATPVNSSLPLGCIVGQEAVVDGQVVATLDGVGTAEACCARCRQAAQDGLGVCNCFNHCSRPKGCSFEDVGVRKPPVNLQHLQCELRYQELASASTGWPPFLLGKGPGVQFSCGAPLQVWGPELPGFARLLGRGLFTHGRYTCPGSLRPELEECLRAGQPSRLAQECEADAHCAAFVLKPGMLAPLPAGGTLGLPVDLGVFKIDSSPESILLNPSSILYIKQAPPAPAGGGLSAGAIAGVAVGSVLGAAALAAAGWAGLCWRAGRQRGRAQQAQQASTPKLAEPDADSCNLEAGTASPLSSGSTEPPWGVAAEQQEAAAAGEAVGAAAAEAVGAAAAERTSAAAAGAARAAAGATADPADAVDAAAAAAAEADAASTQQPTMAWPDSDGLVSPFAAAAALVLGTSETSAAASGAATPRRRAAGSPPAPVALAGPRLGTAASAPSGDLHSQPPLHPGTSLGAARAGSGGAGSMPPSAQAQAAAAAAAEQPSGLQLPTTAQRVRQGASGRLPSARSMASSGGLGPGQLSRSANLSGSTGILFCGSATLPELVQHVAAVEQAAAAVGSTSTSSKARHALISAETLPPRLREWLVAPEEVTYLRWPNGRLRELGSGASARVVKALYRGEVVAAKEMDLAASPSVQEAFLTEALLLHALRHPHVIGFYGVMLRGTTGVVLQEFAEGRDLRSALEVLASGTQQRLFGWHRRGKRVAFEVAKALNYLHSKGVIHMDIKSSNVLLTASGTAKLADVAFSRLLERSCLSNVPLVGTFAWIAPEVLLGSRQVTQAADIFSYGVLLHEIVTGELPQRGKIRMPLVPAECPQLVSDLIMECLSEQPAERPPAAQLLQRLGVMQERPQQAPPGAEAAPGVGRASA